jgi:DNA topoisomerase IA
MNSRRMNRLEELGRVDAEKADTRKGKRNLKDEKKRIVRELKAKDGKVKGVKEDPMRDRMKQPLKTKGL